MGLVAPMTGQLEPMPACEGAARPRSRDVMNTGPVHPRRKPQSVPSRDPDSVEPNTKGIHKQTASHTQTPRPSGQIRILYALHCPSQWKAFYPSPGHPITAQHTGVLVSYSTEGQASAMMTGFCRMGECAQHLLGSRTHLRPSGGRHRGLS